MTSFRETTLSIGLAFFFAACSSSSPNTEASGQAGAGVGGGAPHTAGTGSGNTAGTSSGNAAGTSAGNTAGSGSNAAGNSGNTGGSNGAAGNGSSTTAGTSAGGGSSSSAGATGQAGGSSAAGAGPAPVLPDVVTSANGAFWKTGTLTPSTSGTVDVTANDTSLKQRWDGFGGTFNEAGWDALLVLPPADQALAISLLFDAANGANFAYGRLPIGASDYAMKRYTLAETANDYTMASFTIAQASTNPG